MSVVRWNISHETVQSENHSDTDCTSESRRTVLHFVWKLGPLECDL